MEIMVQPICEKSLLAAAKLPEEEGTSYFLSRVYGIVYTPSGEVLTDRECIHYPPCLDDEEFVLYALKETEEGFACLPSFKITLTLCDLKAFEGVGQPLNGWRRTFGVRLEQNYRKLLNTLRKAGLE